MYEIIVSTLTALGINIASSAVFEIIKSFAGKQAPKADVINALNSIKDLQGKVDAVYDALKQQSVFHENSGFVEISGAYNATGSGLVIGLDVQGPAKIAPGTVVNVSGSGTVIGLRIGGGK